MSRYKIDSWPAPKGGMTVGMPKGVKITDTKTGRVVICDSHNSQHLNRAACFEHLGAETNDQN